MMKDKILSLLEEYLDAPEAWSDDTMIEIDPAEPGKARLCDENDGVDPDTSDLDYWEVMDLLQMSVSDPGRWEPNPDAVAELVASYA